MQVHYQYVPPIVEQTPVKTLKQYASITIYIKRNGAPIPMPKFEYEDADLIVQSGGSYDDIMSTGSPGKPRIRLRQGGTIVSSERASPKLIQVKDKLPEIFRKMAASVPAEPLVDLMTGQTVEQKISIEYLFHDEVYETTFKETKPPAWVQFYCPIVSPEIEATGTCGKVTIEYGQTKLANSWRINSMGWLPVPEGLAEEEIKGAFQDLAKNLLQQGIATVPTWHVKLGTVIGLQ